LGNPKTLDVIIDKYWRLNKMKKLFTLATTALFCVCLTGCAASSTSPIGVNCNFSQGLAEWDLPLACQGK
jgi:hypothetical protein